MKINSGFTLIELLVTISIIGILTAVASVSYTGIRARGRDAQRKNDISQVKIAVSSFYNAQVPPAFPASATNCAVTTGSCATLTITGSDLLTAAIIPAYLQKMPLDPTNSGNYVYKYVSFAQNGSANQAYTQTATLENTNDKKGWGTGGTAWAIDGYIVQND